MSWIELCLTQWFNTQLCRNLHKRCSKLHKGGAADYKTGDNSIPHIMIHQIQTDDRNTSLYTVYYLLPLIFVYILSRDLINCTAFLRLFKSSTLQIMNNTCSLHWSQHVNPNSCQAEERDNRVYLFCERKLFVEVRCRRQKHDRAPQAIMSLVMRSPNNHLSSRPNHEILTRGNSCSA